MASGESQFQALMDSGLDYVQAWNLTGSDVLALTGDIDIQAREVDITEARETRSSTSQQSSKSTVLGATPRNALVDAIKGAKTTLDTAQATAQTGNSRVQALGAAATALSAYNTANQVAELVAAPEKIASITIDFNLGSNKSRSESTETVNSGRGSTVAAAGDVRIVAKGAGTDSDILIRGSDVSAGQDATLKADGDVRLESSQDRTTLHSTNNSSGASIGVGVSFGASNGITFNASANKARGNADGQDAIQRNTHIVAGNTARIESGADTTLAGASVTGKTVQAEVGGSLNIESRQDTSTFTSDQQSSGFGLSHQGTGRARPEARPGIGSGLSGAQLQRLPKQAAGGT
ncbi:hemagglutinin repeat-containing protein [Hydrogenophaga sp. Root209]|uniref:hemagglutinin repeat-containing protein n=1 Tax=Hydrogenophaga sp. Root209 TaxID=1736490 RepID=UPI0012E33B1D|nr:hemagglutinin repeat-containing protein [Hydrogenophaga sp. Root209]